MTYIDLPEDIDPEHRLGRNIHHDPRSRAYAFKSERPLTAALEAVEHTVHIPILDQGYLGSCVPNTGVEYLASSKFYVTLPPEVQNNLDQEFAIELYRQVTRRDPFIGAWEPDDTGSDGLSLAKLLKDLGLISGYTHTFDPASALVALQDFPLAIGIDWLTGCDSPNLDGLISYTGRSRGGHEVLVVGYDPVKQWIKIRNHWGPEWGINGHCFMTVVDFTRAIQNRGDVIIFTPLTMPAPEPQPVDKATPADVEFAKVLEPWSKNIVSKVTKAGKVSEQFKEWKKRKGL